MFISAIWVSVAMSMAYTDKSSAHLGSCAPHYSIPRRLSGKLLYLLDNVQLLVSVGEEAVTVICAWRCQVFGLGAKAARNVAKWGYILTWIFLVLVDE